MDNQPRKRICLLATTLALGLLLGLLSGCSTSAGAYCKKRQECCAEVGDKNCENENKEGWLDRCTLDLEEDMDQFRTYNDSACDDLIELREAYWDCYASSDCSALNSSDTCLEEAKAYTSARSEIGSTCSP